MLVFFQYRRLARFMGRSCAVRVRGASTRRISTHGRSMQTMRAFVFEGQFGPSSCTPYITSYAPETTCTIFGKVDISVVSFQVSPKLNVSPVVLLRKLMKPSSRSPEFAMVIGAPSKSKNIVTFDTGMLTVTLPSFSSDKAD